MLQVVFLIIKIILIILAVLLGCALLILLLALFVPVRYRAYGVRNQRECRAEGRLSWLFSLICVPASWQEGELCVRVKVLGFRIMEFPGQEDGDFSEQTWMEMEDADSGETAEPQRTASETTEQEKPFSEGVKQKAEDFRHTEFRDTDPDMDSDSNPGPDEKKTSRFVSVLQDTAGFIRRIFRFIGGIPAHFKNLKCTISRFCGKIKQMIRKYQRMKAFALDERTKAAVALIWKQAGILLRQALPRKIRGELHFGTDDPALTGQILGGISIFYPLFMDNVKVIPDFENTVLEGELSLKGRIRAVTVLRIAWRLYRDRNVRRLYRRLNR